MSLKRNSLFNLAGLLLPLGLSLLTVPAYIHLIGVDRYGVLAIAWLLLGYFGMFDLGLGRATVHRIAELRDVAAAERRATFHTAVLVNAAIGVVGGILLALGAELFFANGLKVAPALKTELAAAAPLLGLSLPIATLTGVLTGALQGRERFASSNIAGVLSTVLFQGVPLAVAWLWGPNVSVLLLAGMATRLVTLVVLWAVCTREFGWDGRLRFDRAQIAPLLRFGGWITVASLIAPFLTIIDRFAIGAVMGAAAVTFYAIPYQMTQRIVIIPTALTNALFPRLSAMKSLEEAAMLSRESMLILVALMTAPVVLGVLLAGPALSAWLGDAFAARATLPAEILLVAFWFNALALLPFTMLQAGGRPQTVALVLAIELLPYLAALYLGLHHFGLVGCAAAFLLRCALDYALLSFHADRRATPVRPILTGAAMLGLAVGISRVTQPFSGHWLAAAALLLLLVAVETWRIAPARIRTPALERLASLRRPAPSPGQH
ncbi:flippase [Sphingomonas sp.]|uniref:flippase n=1 Tax=Sphingomonas sp. TaxID=28214 RepID=UPI0035C7DE54